MKVFAVPTGSRILIRERDEGKGMTLPRRPMDFELAFLS